MQHMEPAPGELIPQRNSGSCAEMRRSKTNDRCPTRLGLQQTQRNISILAPR